MFNYENNITEDGIEYGQTEVFYYRIFWETGYIGFGVRKNFDRWANSTDFEYHGITNKNKEIVFNAAQIAYENGMYNDETDETYELSIW